MRTIIAVGGGPSSCLFAYLAKKRFPQDKVIIYEASDSILKRVLISGNGRGNFFNEAFAEGKADKAYRNPSVFASFISPQDAKEFLSIIQNDLGLEFFSDEEGRIYPFSNTSSSLKDAIENGLKKEDVEIHTLSRINNISLSNRTVSDGKNESNFDVLFIGTGGSAFDRKADANTALFKQLGLPAEETQSALCPLKTNVAIPRYLDGTRLKGKAVLTQNGKKIFAEDGEVLFKKDGLSGICIFDSSLYINEKEKGYVISIDPFTHSGKNVNFQGEKNPEALLGLFPYSLVRFLTDEMKKSLTAEQIRQELQFGITEKYPLENSQISLGGVSPDVLNPDFSLKNDPHIYLGGEELDIHAICGGFNMGLAFLSGMKAALSLK
jgi:predicted Rossmann fold flavoprotein